MLHSAVLLAGGKSSRMGLDKAALQIEGEPLWQRQLGTLRGTQPRELFISGLRNGPYADSGVRIISDPVPDLGPLAGIAASLQECTSEWLLVLAVDLPQMPADYLSRMVRTATKYSAGIIPLTGPNQLEPLAAVYPKRALPVAEARVSAKQLKLADFIADLEARGWMRRLEVSAVETAYFTNWNSPEDVKRPA